MNEKTVRVSRSGAVARIVLDRPERLNALTSGMLKELRTCVADLAGNEELRVAVLCGAGRAFAAGVDLRVLSPEPEALAHGDVGTELNALAREVIASIEALPFPVIAQVHGACFTGALEIALACDWIVAAEEALFGDTHAKLGLRPTWGMTARLAQAVGPRRARELSFTARSFSGVEAGEWGLANFVVPRADLEAAVDALCAQVAGNSPSSLAAYKALYCGNTATDLVQRLRFEAESQFPCPEAPERIEAYVASLSRR